MQQLPLISNWISGADRMPIAGQRVLQVYQLDDGSLSAPIVGTPVHADGSHIVDGESIYRPTAWWQPIEEVPQ